MTTDKAASARDGTRLGRPPGTGHPYAPAVARRKLTAYCEELRVKRERLRWMRRLILARHVPYDGLLEARAMQIAYEARQLHEAAVALRPRTVRRGC